MSEHKNYLEQTTILSSNNKLKFNEEIVKSDLIKTKSKFRATS